MQKREKFLNYETEDIAFIAKNIKLRVDKET